MEKTLKSIMFLFIACASFYFAGGIQDAIICMPITATTDLVMEITHQLLLLIGIASIGMAFCEIF